MKIMDVIRSECKRRKWGALDLAAAIGMGSSPCYRWLVPGRAQVQDTSIDKMLTALEFDPSWMYWGPLLVKRLQRIQAITGNPDPHEGCRLIIAEAQAALDEVLDSEDDGDTKT